MTDVKARLALLDVVLDEAAPPVDVSEVQLRAQTAPVVPDAVSPRVRPAWVAVAAAVATLVLVGGFALLVGSGNRGDVRPATTLPDTTVTTVPIAVDPVAVDAGWSRWPTDPAVFDQAAVADVVSLNGTLFAVGSTVNCNPCDARVWMSRNGVDWTPVFTDQSGGVMVAAAAGEHGIVAVGETITEDRAIATAWASPDGVSWVRGALPDGLQAWDVAAGGPGYVAVGYVQRVEGDTFYDDAAVWTSTDGSVWTRVADDADLFTNAWIFPPATTADGLVAIGSAPVSYETDEEGFGWYEHTLGVWTSPDGVDWTHRDVGDVDVDVWMGEMMDAVTVGDSFLFASPNGLWFSTDLTEWQQVSPAFTRSVTSTGSSFFAALQNQLDGTSILQSQDAVNWAPITDDPLILFTADQNIEMTVIRPGGPGLIAFGIDYSGPGQGTLQLWTWSPN